MRSRSPRLPGALLMAGLLIVALLLGGCGGSGTAVASPSAVTATALPVLTGTAGAGAIGSTTPAASRPTPTVRAATSQTTARPTTTPTPRGQAARPPPSDGLPTIELAALPSEARETIRLIERGGPFPYDRDGITFGNRERLLPLRSSGYYREYTVVTPGSADRGARRVIAGEGDELYYTDDHYDSFRRVVR